MNPLLLVLLKFVFVLENVFRLYAVERPGAFVELKRGLLLVAVNPADYPIDFVEIDVLNSDF